MLLEAQCRQEDIEMVDDSALTAENDQDIEMPDAPDIFPLLRSPVQHFATSHIPAKRHGYAPRKLRKRARDELEFLDSMSKTLMDCNMRLEFSPTGTLEQAEKDYNRLCEAISRLNCRATAVASRKADLRQSLDLFRGRIDDVRKSRTAESIKPVRYDTGLLSHSPSRIHSSSVLSSSSL